MVTVSASDPQITDNTSITTYSDNINDKKLSLNTVNVSNEKNEINIEKTQKGSLQNDCEEKLLRLKDVNTELNSIGFGSEINHLKFNNPKFEPYFSRNYINSYTFNYLCSELTFNLTFQEIEYENDHSSDKIIDYYLKGDTETSISNKTNSEGQLSITHSMPTLSVYTLYHSLQNKLSFYNYTKMKLNFKHKLKLTSNYNQYTTYDETPHLIQNITNSTSTQISGITIKSNNITSLKTNSNGQMTFTVPSTYSLSSSQHNVNFYTNSVEMDEYFQSKVGVSLKANSQTPTISASIPNTFVYGASDNIITVTLTDSISGAALSDQTIKYKIDEGSEQTASSTTNSKGQVYIALPDNLAGGSHNFDFSSVKNTDYNSASGTQQTFNIKTQQSSMGTSDVSYSFVYGYDVGSVVVNLFDVEGVVVPGVVVNCTLWLGNKEITDMPVVRSGEAFSIPKGLAGGEYTLMYDFGGNENYTKSSMSTSITINPQQSSISTSDVSYNFIFNSESNTVTINLYNAFDDLLLGKKISYNFNGETKEVVSGVEFVLPIKGLKVDTYTLSYQFKGDENYTKSSMSTSITIGPQQSSMGTSDVSYSFVYGYDVGSVVVNLFDVEGVVVPGVVVNCTLWLGNKEITDMPVVRSGEAFSIPKGLAGGEYTLMYDFGGNENYTKSSMSTSITINPQQSSISTSDVSYNFIFNSESNTVTINLYNAFDDLLLGKKISYNFNGETKEAVSGEAFVLPITGLKVGDYTLSYQFMGDENYTKSNVVTTNINVIQQTPNISTPYLKYTFTYGVDNAIIVTLTDSKSNDPLEGKTIKYHFDSLTAETLITNSNGQVSIPVSKDLTAALNHILNYNFVGDYNYTNRTGLQVNFTINSRKTFVNNSMDHYIFIEGTNSNTVPVFLYDVYKTKLLTGKTIYYNINGVNGFTNDGIISIPNGLPGGRVYTLTYTFRGDDNYIKSSNSSLIFIQKITHFEGFNLSTINSSVNYTVCLKTLDGNVLSNESLLFVFNNTYYPVVTNVNGVACLSLNNLSLGSYNVDYVYFGNNLYTSSNGFSNINVVDKLKTDSNIILTYDVKGKVLNFNLTSNNIPINEANITVLINGTNYTLITDKDGLASIDLSNYSLGTYNLSYYYPGNKDINKCNGSCNISVTNPIDSVLTLNNYTMTVGLLGNLTGKLTTFNGTPLNGMVIFLNLTNLGNNLSKVYNVTSDINGDYALPINLAVGEYSASASYLGKTIGNNTYLNIGPVYSSISIKANMTFVGTVLSVNNLTETYGDGLNLTGKLLDINGKPVIGQHILLNLTRLSDGVSKIYPCTTDNTGEYQLEINLYPGEYSVSGSFNGLTVKNVTYSLSTIINGSILINKVVTVLSADEFLAKVNYGLIFTGKLINSESEPLSNQMISINLNNSRNGLSKTYYVYTDTNGVYSLVINLAKGSYTAQCSFTGTNEYESSIANTSLSIKA
ncbi:Ig-like domain-containing protein [Methanobrevibacter acididurans]|uniref:Ig-like domain-containing protein n=1 Tax=Methanobrevibacter acididurans TaxID=120963 RepID=UPI0038FC4E4A